MKIRSLIILMFISAPVFAQINFSGGMGIYFSANPNLNDYLNKFWASPYEKVSTFNSNVEFYLEAAYPLKNNLQIGIDYGYSIYSYGSAYKLPYEISYSLHSPTLMAYYVQKGEGYQYRLGGGFGYRILQLEEKIYYPVKYDANGYGFEIKADGNTSLGGNLYANIGTVLRFDFFGETVPNENKPVDRPAVLLENIETVKFTTFSAGLRLGITYIF